MVSRIRKFQILNSQIFAVLNNYHSIRKEVDDVINDGQVRLFEPPIYESLTTEIEV